MGSCRFRLFWAHVLVSAHRHAEACVNRLLAEWLLQALDQAEVDDLGLWFSIDLGHHDIGWFQVTVNHRLSMRMLDSITDIDEERQALFQGESVR